MSSLFFGILIGAMITGLVLSVFLTIYLKDQSKKTTKVTTVTTTSVTSTTSSTSTSSTSSTTTSTSSSTTTTSTSTTTTTSTTSTTTTTTTITTSTSTTSTTTTTTTSTTTTTTTSTTTSSTTSTTTTSTSSTTTTTSPKPYSYIFWSFDSNPNDLYNVYNGVAMNGATYVSPGYTGYGSALSLDGTLSQYVLVTNYKDMTFTSLTWEVWAYPTNLNNNYDNLMLGMCQTISNSSCMYLMVRQNRTYFAFYANDCWGSTNLLVNNWYHFAFVYDYSLLTQFIYLNGILECSHNSSAPFQATSGAMTIGAINNTGGVSPASFWTGYIDQMSYVSRAKTSDEILTDATLIVYYSFDGGSFYDGGPNKINGTGVNVISTGGRVNESLLFNVNGSYFQAGGLTLLGVVAHSYSVSIWINKPLSTSPGGTIIHLSGNSNGTNWCLPMLGLSSTNEIIGQNWNFSMISTVGPVVQLGVWTHIVSSYSLQNGLRLWINGSLFASSPLFTYEASGIPDWITVGSTFAGAMTCASANVSVGQFYGMIDELRIYSRELTSTEVFQLANP